MGMMSSKKHHEKEKHVNVDVQRYMGVSLNGGTPISHPKMIIFR